MLEDTLVLFVSNLLNDIISYFEKPYRIQKSVSIARFSYLSPKKSVWMNLILVLKPKNPKYIPTMSRLNRFVIEKFELGLLKVRAFEEKKIIVTQTTDIWLKHSTGNTKYLSKFHVWYVEGSSRTNQRTIRSVQNLLYPTRGGLSERRMTCDITGTHQKAHQGRNWYW